MVMAVLPMAVAVPEEAIAPEVAVLQVLFLSPTTALPRFRLYLLFQAPRQRVLHPAAALSAIMILL